MKILKFNAGEGRLKVRPDIPDDLWTLQRIIFPGDLVRSESLRKFKSNEGDVGELKQVVITVRVEKTEFDKAAGRLRIMGKIVEGRPMDYIKLNSYHTLNIAPGEELFITKAEWHDYIVSVVRNAVSDTRKARLGIIVVDDEKAMAAYLLGYGMEFRDEIYSRLSKRMSQKDFQEAERKYFRAVLDAAEGMHVDTVIIAGPGFTKDDIRKFGEDNDIIRKMTKRLIFESTSNADRPGVYELIRGEGVANILQRERIRQEFKLMEEFLNGLEPGRSKYGAAGVEEALDSYSAKFVIVNDSVLGDPSVQRVLASAEQKGVRIEVFNAGDEVGAQLHGFRDIGCVG